MKLDCVNPRKQYSYALVDYAQDIATYQIAYYSHIIPLNKSQAQYIVTPHKFI